MKYCQTCGAEINDLAEICPKCGVRCVPNVQGKPESSEDKPIKGTGLGFVLGFFLGLIGALLCHFLGDEKAKKTAWITFIIETCAGFLLGVIIGIVGLAIF